MAQCASAFSSTINLTGQLEIQAKRMSSTKSQNYASCGNVQWMKAGKECVCSEIQPNKHGSESVADLVSARSFGMALIIILSNATRAVARRTVLKGVSRPARRHRLSKKDCVCEKGYDTAIIGQLCFCVRARSCQLRVSAFLELVLLTLCLWIKATSIDLRFRVPSLVNAAYLLFLHELVAATDQLTQSPQNQSINSTTKSPSPWGTKIKWFLFWKKFV